MMKHFAKTVYSFQPLIAFAKKTIIDIWKYPKYVFNVYFNNLTLDENKAE